jgi:hypothetical protein
MAFGMTSGGNDYTAMTWSGWNSDATTLGTVSNVWGAWNFGSATTYTDTTNGTTDTAWTVWTTTVHQLENSQRTQRVRLEATWGQAEAGQIWSNWSWQVVPSRQSVTNYPAQRQMTPEELAAQQELFAKQEKERREKAAIAQQKALALLVSILTAEQLASWEKDKSIPVDAVSGKRYIIKPGRSGNVVSIKDGKPIERYCIHPNDYEMPDEDVMLAQKLLLETDEEAFLRIANMTRLAA